MVYGTSVNEQTSVLWGVDVGDVVDGGTCHWYSGRFTAAGTVVRLLPC